VTAFPSLSVPFGLRRVLSVDVTQRLRGDGTCERVWRNGHVRHAFEIPWSLLSAANRTTLDTFFQAIRGRYLGDISYTDPWDSVVYTCRLDSDAIELAEASQGRWGATIRLVEVADFPANKTPVVTFPALASGAVVQFPYRMARQYRTVVEAQEDDSEKRWEDLAIASGIQRWAVGGDLLTDAEATTLLNCWEGNGGPWAEMTSFTEPETATLYTSTHFVETECVHELVDYNRNAVRLTVEELKAA